MDSSKAKIIDRFFIFLILFYIFLVPFGQITRLDLKILNLKIPLILYDFTALIILVIHIFYGIKLRITKQMLFFFMVALFSFLINFKFVFDQYVLNSVLYLVRLASWGAIYSAVIYLIDKKLIDKINLKKYIYYSIFATCFLGFLQYLFIPDLRFLINFGWDDHLNRLTGLYFDPAYIGFMAIIAFFLSFYICAKKNSLIFLIFIFSQLFFLAVLFLTYSRASYLALFVGLFYFFSKFHSKRLIRYLFVAKSISILIFLVFSILRFEGEGVRLARMTSINQRFDNYLQTLLIIKDYPLFGVGFNNICKIRISYFGGDINSHSCNGADASILFVWATTGIIGVLVFIHLLYSLFFSHRSEILMKTLLICLFVHSLFSNSMFYSIIVGVLIILIAIKVDPKGQS